MTQGVLKNKLLTPTTVHHTTPRFIITFVYSFDLSFLNVFRKEASKEHVDSVCHHGPAVDGRVSDVGSLLIDEVGDLILGGGLVWVVVVILLHHPDPLPEVPNPLPESLPPLLKSPFSVT